MRVATVVEATGDAPRTVSGEIGQQIDHPAIAATAIDQSFYGIAPCPAAFAADDAQTAKPGAKIVESDSAVARHDDTSRHGNARRPPVLDSQFWIVRKP
jgi:hypothetical protein